MKTSSAILGLTLCAVLAAPAARADEVADLKAQLQALQQQMNALQQQLQQVTDKIEKREVSEGSGAAKANPGQTAQPIMTAHRMAAVEPGPAPEEAAEGAGGHGFFERKPGDSFTFYTPGGEVTAYGNVDLSFDAVTKGIAGKIGPDGNPPVGKVGWLPDISTNLSYLGVHGFQSLDGLPFKFVYQLETQLDVAATSGSGETNSTDSNVVKGALTSRNSYIGLASEVWGAVMAGKTDAPYKMSTARMNPFSGMIGDNQSIMGNTGGDNRVEFGTRLDHSIWYESPNKGGLVLDILYSPGQNRASNSDNIAAGESDCTGGNVPGSGGITPVTCSDGSFSDAVSGSLSYTRDSLYVTAAYERHMRVNRSSDITGIYGSGNGYSMMLQAQDVADEDAGKIAAQYIFPTKTTLSGIFETLHRYVPQDLEFQNERQRLGAWLCLSQKLNRATSLHFGWAHAFRTPGDPGQHNDSLITPPGGVPGTDFTAGAHADNTANMFTVMLRYQLTKILSLYTDWAMTANGPAAHFDLGGGGRAVATDCHDAYDSTGGLIASNPHCWTGGRLMGLSVGMDWRL
jgi:predicted porin